MGVVSSNEELLPARFLADGIRSDAAGKTWIAVYWASELFKLAEGPSSLSGWAQLHRHESLSL